LSADLRHDPATDHELHLADGRRMRWFSLEEVAVPTSVHQGSADTSVPPHWAELLVAGIPRRDLTTYEGEGHLIGVSRRVEIARALTA
jgi:pimeloyl-ACP methyl ester carboxylesterase